jgi:hypothetical protein
MAECTICTTKYNSKTLVYYIVLCMYKYLTDVMRELCELDYLGR